MSIIITIISNITVLVSLNIICLEYSITTSHGVNKKVPPIVSPHSSPLQELMAMVTCCCCSWYGYILVKLQTVAIVVVVVVLFWFLRKLTLGLILPP